MANDRDDREAQTEADEPAPLGGSGAPADDQPTGKQPRTGDVGQRMPWDSEGAESKASAGSSSRVSVIAEQPPRPAPPSGATEEDYKWHSYRVYPSGRPDAVEFIDVYKSFGRARVLAGLNM